MVDLGVRDHHSTATHQRLGCGSNQGLDRGTSTAKDLVARADRLLEKGDIVGARAIYQRAAELGDASAALALGATYDPNRLWSLGALGLVGNKERARQWYLRASELGHREAKARLTILGF